MQHPPHLFAPPDGFARVQKPPDKLTLAPARRHRVLAAEELEVVEAAALELREGQGGQVVLHAVLLVQLLQRRLLKPELVRMHPPCMCGCVCKYRWMDR